MSDLVLTFGSDLQFDSDGDLSLSDGPALTKQRVLRRLLTNKGDYIWQLNYGAGLAQYIGQPGAVAMISGVIKAQLSLESQVSANPAPQILFAENQGNNFMLSLQYADMSGGQSNTIKLTI